MRDLVPWPEIKPGPPALGGQSLSHGNTWGSPKQSVLKCNILNVVEGHWCNREWCEGCPSLQSEKQERWARLPQAFPPWSLPRSWRWHVGGHTTPGGAVFLSRGNKGRATGVTENGRLNPRGGIMKGAPQIFIQTPSKSSSLQTQQKTAVAGKVTTTMWPERCLGCKTSGGAHSQAASWPEAASSSCPGAGATGWEAEGITRCFLSHLCWRETESEVSASEMGLGKHLSFLSGSQQGEP